jgi:hypothetical protein
MKLLNASQDHAKHVRASAHCGQFLDFMLFQFIVTFIYILAFLSKMNILSRLRKYSLESSREHGIWRSTHRLLFFFFSSRPASEQVQYKRKFPTPSRTRLSDEQSKCWKRNGGSKRYRSERRPPCWAQAGSNMDLARGTWPSTNLLHAREQGIPAETRVFSRFPGWARVELGAEVAL